MKLLFLPGSVFPNSYQDKYFKTMSIDSRTSIRREYQSNLKNDFFHHLSIFLA